MDGGEPQPGFTCALAGLQDIARASPEVGQGQSLEVVQQNCQHQKGFCIRVVKRPYQKPRRRVGRGVVHQECVEVRGRLKWRGGLLIAVPSSARLRETRRNPLPSGVGGCQEMAQTPAVFFNESPGSSPSVDRSRRYARILLVLIPVHASAGKSHRPWRRRRLRHRWGTGRDGGGRTRNTNA